MILFMPSYEGTSRIGASPSSWGRAGSQNSSPIRFFLSLRQKRFAESHPSRLLPFFPPSGLSKLDCRLFLLSLMSKGGLVWLLGSRAFSELQWPSRGRVEFLPLLGWCRWVEADGCRLKVWLNKRFTVFSRIAAHSSSWLAGLVPPLLLTSSATLLLRFLKTVLSSWGKGPSLALDLFFS